MFNNVPFCSEAEFLEAVELTDKYAPMSAPLGWKPLSPFPNNSPLFGTKVYQRLGDRLAVIISASKWPNDPDPSRVWLHVSLSRPHSMPSYEDMCDVKALFIGADRKALQVFAEESQHISIHNFCLHLWSVVEGDDGLPNFGEFGSI